MSEKSRGGLFRPRNIIGAALVAGIGLGVYLGPLFKGWGLGDGTFLGITGPNSDTQVNVGKETTSSNSPKNQESTDDSLPTEVPEVVKVVIDDRSYFLRHANGDTPIQLPQLVKLAKSAPGDPDGIKIRIYEKASARMSAEEALKSALLDAEIPDTAVFLVPNQVK